MGDYFLVNGLRNYVHISIYEFVSFLYPVCAWNTLTECCTGGINDKHIEQLYINPLQLWGPLWGILVALSVQFLCFLSILTHNTQTYWDSQTLQSVSARSFSTVHIHCTLELDLVFLGLFIYHASHTLYIVHVYFLSTSFFSLNKSLLSKQSGPRCS